MRPKFKEILIRVQDNTQCHPAFVAQLQKLKNKIPPKEFIPSFLEMMCVVLQSPNFEHDPYVVKALQFIAMFVGKAAKIEVENDSEQFLRSIMNKLLNCTNLKNVNIRFNACRLLLQILIEITDIDLDNDFCDEIQDALIERVYDPKLEIRLCAIQSLARLQMPRDPDCSVTKTLLDLLNDPIAKVRNETVKILATSNRTWMKIKNRIRDVDKTVRLSAFTKCADVEPTSLKIALRGEILQSGFCDQNDNVKKCFFNVLLPKWMLAYNNDFIKFFAALNLTVNDQDLKQLKDLTKKLVDFIFIKFPISTVLGGIPINSETKLIDIKDLSVESVLLWYHCIAYLRADAEIEDHKSTILSEPSEFCTYLKDIIEAKSKEQMDNFQMAEYYFILENLFEIAEGFDYSDEYGRQLTRKMTYSMLKDYTFNPSVTKSILNVAEKCSTSIDNLIGDICDIINTFLEPTPIEQEVQPLTAEQAMKQKFEISDVRFQINILEDKLCDAIQNREYINIEDIETLLTAQRAKLTELLKEKERPRGVHQKTKSNDTVVTCHCLDILIALLELKRVSKTTPKLDLLVKTFLHPLFATANAQTHWRILNAFILYAIIDEATAKEYARIVFIPMLTYGEVSNIDVLGMIKSITGIADLLVIYGTEIIREEDDNDDVLSQTSSKRTLYGSESNNFQLNELPNHKSLTIVYKILIDMLDSKIDDIRYNAIRALTSLMLNKLPVSASVVTSLILKWFHPLTEMNDVKLSIRIGRLLQMFTKEKFAESVIIDAIIPVLVPIANDSKKVYDIDKMVLFCADIIKNIEERELYTLIGNVLSQIDSDKSDRSVPYLIKFLCHLNLSLSDVDLIEVLIVKAGDVAKGVQHKMNQRNLMKFGQDLKFILDKISREKNNGNVTNLTNRTIETTVSNNNHVQENVQVTRRKQRMSKECVVKLARLPIELINKKVTINGVPKQIEIVATTDRDIISDTDSSERTHRSEKRKSRRLLKK